MGGRRCEVNEIALFEAEHVTQSLRVGHEDFILSLALDGNRAVDVSVYSSSAFIFQIGLDKETREPSNISIVCSFDPLSRVCNVAMIATIKMHNDFEEVEADPLRAQSSPDVVSHPSTPHNLSCGCQNAQ